MHSCGTAMNTWWLRQWPWRWRQSLLRFASSMAPVIRALRPDHPYRLLRGPFGRHVKAVGGRLVCVVLFILITMLD
jgi:hypothetical protein